MWQSRVEIEGYSVAYFDCIAAFEALYRWTFIKSGAHMHFVDSWCIDKGCMSPALNWSSARWHFKHSNVIEISDGITFDFYTGLPHHFLVYVIVLFLMDHLHRLVYVQIRSLLPLALPLKSADHKYMSSHQRNCHLFWNLNLQPCTVSTKQRRLVRDWNLWWDLKGTLLLILEEVPLILPLITL